MKLNKMFVIVLACFMCMWLIMSFIDLELNLTKWTRNERLIYLAFSILSSVFCLVIASQVTISDDEDFDAYDKYTRQ